MFNYILQVLFFQTVFLAVYDLFLKKETFFQWNRAYLLLTSIIAYGIPFLKFSSVTERIPTEYVVLLPEVVLSPSSYVEKQITWAITLFDVLQIIFFIGILFASLLFGYKLSKIFRIMRENKKEKKSGYFLINLANSTLAFSFFRNIFLGENIQQKEQVIAHELIHVKQKHSIDLVLFEIQKIIFWFNPFSYLFQQRISELHEFIADENTITKENKNTYFEELLAQVFQVEKFSFVNSFFKKSLIKKRIIMLGKNKSQEILKLKYLLLIPVVMGMFLYTSCEKSTEESIKLAKNEKRIVNMVLGEIKNKEGKIVFEKKIFPLKKEGYFDIYMIGDPPDGKEITYNDLSLEEKEEFDRISKENSDKESMGTRTYKLFALPDGTRAIYEKIDINSKDSNDYSNSDEVPFAAIDEAPIFPGCEDAEDIKACFTEKITEHVSTNFNTKIANDLGLESGRKRVYVQFKIDKTGNILDVRARGPHTSLEKEATRVIEQLPKMTPGKQSGKAVGVKYTLPISFHVD